MTYCDGDYVRTDDMVADIGTKSLTAAKLQDLMTKLRMSGDYSKTKRERATAARMKVEGEQTDESSDDEEESFDEIMSRMIRLRFGGGATDDEETITARAMNVDEALAKVTTNVVAQLLTAAMDSMTKTHEGETCPPCPVETTVTTVESCPTTVLAAAAAVGGAMMLAVQALTTKARQCCQRRQARKARRVTFEAGVQAQCTYDRSGQGRFRFLGSRQVDDFCNYRLNRQMESSSDEG